MFKILILILLFSNTCFAEAVQEIYVVDVQKIISESTPGKDLKKSLEVFFEPEKTNLKKKKEELDKLKKNLDSQTALLSQDAIKDKVNFIRQEEVKLAKLANKFQDEFTNKNNSTISKLIKEIQNILDQLAKEKKYKLVIERNPRFVVYANDEIDLTSEVIKIINKKKIEF